MPNFPKIEKLCSSTAIEALRLKGHHYTAWPLRATYHTADAPQHQVLIWAPKALFKHAVDRNLLRRRMRETYRLHKDLLPEQPIYHLAIYYMDKNIQPTPIIEKAMIKLLSRIDQH